MARRVALYLRVSTSGQTVENQRRELEAWAARAGHEIVEIYQDAGISGSKGRDKRPGLDQALKDAARRRYDMLAVWSVDRLGRSLQDAVNAMQELRGTDRGLYLHTQALDTSTPSGRAMYGMLAVFAEFERAIIVERVNAGLARAKAQGVKLGRPKVAGAIEAQVRELRASGLGIKATAKRLNIGTGTVQRIDAEMRAEAAALAA
jgi:DNA invertase Pin-like site-specific DNA recombinase